MTAGLLTNQLATRDCQLRYSLVFIWSPSPAARPNMLTCRLRGNRASNLAAPSIPVLPTVSWLGSARRPPVTAAWLVCPMMSSLA